MASQSSESPQPTTRWVEMSEPIYDEISKRVRQSYPNACLCFIEELVNPPLLERYETFKQRIQERRGDANEQQLFHGTTEEAIRSIQGEGFNPFYSKVAAYGWGTYFAKSASISVGYMRGKSEITYMFLVDVVLGKNVHTGANTKWETLDADSGGNGSTIFVSPHQDAAFPRYCLAFHKNAT